MLPVTSMPLVANLISPGTSVAPPSGLILFLIILVWFIPQIIKRRKFSELVLPILIFATISIIVTLWSFYRIEPIYKENNAIKNSLEAIITLAIGLSFYLVTSWRFTDRKGIEETFRWINWSGLIVLAWSAVQIGAWLLYHRYPDWLRDFHELYSVGPLYRQRISGFAFEPSWFAHQLNMLYLPLWLALSVQRKTVHSFRIWKVSLENILLFGGIVALFVSYSRVGLAAFLLMIGYVMLSINIWLIKKIKNKIQTMQWETLKKIQSGGLYALIGLTMLIFYLAIILLIGYGLSQTDPRMAKLFSIDLNHPDGLLYYANDLTFASRVVYWQAGWNIFNQFPWFGTGLGKAGFYIPQNLSPYAWRLTEVRDLVFRTHDLLNIKSLWLRLLSETGIVGFTLFITWLWGLWRSSGILKKQKDSLMQTLSWMGKFVILGLVLEGFSVDTFALPYFWFSLGIVTAGWQLLKEGEN